MSKEKGDVKASRAAGEFDAKTGPPDAGAIVVVNLESLFDVHICSHSTLGHYYSISPFHCRHSQMIRREMSLYSSCGLYMANWYQTISIVRQNFIH